MNHLLYSVLFMIIGSFALQYYVMSYLMTSSPQDVTSSLGKAYISIIMAFAMGILEVLMNDFMMKTIHWSYYILLVLLLGLFIILYRKQVGISDNEYLKEMIEHHSMAILTSEEILQKTHNYKIKHLASNIKNTQKEEIKQMKKMLT